MQVYHPFVLSFWKANRRIQSNQLHILSRSWSNNSANLWVFIISPLWFGFPFWSGCLCSTPSLLVQMWFTIFLRCDGSNSSTARNSSFWVCCGLSMDKWTQVEIKTRENRKSINPFPKGICLFLVFWVKEDSKHRVSDSESVRQVYSLKRDTKSLRIKCQLPPHGCNSQNFCSIQNLRILLICKA